MAELADAQDSGSCDRKVVQVQVLSSAPHKKYAYKRGRIFCVRHTGQCTCLRSPFTYGQANRVHCFAFRQNIRGKRTAFLPQSYEAPSSPPLLTSVTASAPVIRTKPRIRAHLAPFLHVADFGHLRRTASRFFCRQANRVHCFAVKAKHTRETPFICRILQMYPNRQIREQYRKQLRNLLQYDCAFCIFFPRNSDRS